MPKISQSEHLFAALLHQNLRGILALSGGQTEELWRHYQLLVHWTRVLNLTAIRRPEEAVPRHYCESLFVAAHLPPQAISIVDVGSGAGFPGIPIAIARPDCRVTLVESHQRKAVFLREASRDYPNVDVIPRRAEELKNTFDWLVTRAVSRKGIMPLVPRLAGSLALLLGGADSSKLLKETQICWDEPIPVPWGERRVLLVGSYVSRGTSKPYSAVS